MGLLKETILAINRIDQNLAQLVKVQTMAHKDIFTPPYERIIPPDKPFDKRVSSVEPIDTKPVQEQEFIYREIEHIGARICAVRKYLGISQIQLAKRLAVNSSYISKLETGESMPSGTLIRLLSLIANIDEQWLATGHLPQTTEEPAKPLATSKVTPLSGYEDAKELLKKHFNLQRRMRLGVEEQSGNQDDPQ